MELAESIAPLVEAIDVIIEAGRESLKLCFQCGSCAEWINIETEVKGLAFF
ncbi:MAG: hypothetical protein ACW963_03045 [Candidatus Sifarchaeia archaeon]|jgi:hypothetical protein